MKIYKTQAEVEKDIRNGVLAIRDDVKFECSISLEASINAWNITARRGINALNINALNIDAGNIDALDINAWGINARDINARGINARDINAQNINAWNINARDIVYYAFCCVYQSIKCVSIKAIRGIHKEPICLDGKIEYKTPDSKSRKIKIRLAEGQIVEGEIVG
ncbi:MAG: hypothetical protein ACTSQI_21755 [Candidatus Helarchaeota archaeon]